VIDGLNVLPGESEPASGRMESVRSSAGVELLSGMRSLLVLTYHFPPSAASGSHRLLGFARHLPGSGWRTIVVAPPRLPWEALDPQLSSLLPPETVVYSVPHELSGATGLPLRLLAYYSSWLPRAWPVCVRAIRIHKPAAILTSGPPHAIHVLGLLLKRRFGLPWVADFRDPWVAGTAAARARGLRSRLAQALESAVMRRSDRILGNAPNASELIRSNYPSAAAKVRTITNGYDAERFSEAEPAASGAIDIVHPGQIYAGRDPRPFLDALSAVASTRSAGGRPVRAIFVGDLNHGSRSTRLADEIARRGLQTLAEVRVHVPYETSLLLMTGAGILLLLDSPGRKVGVPAKLYEYIGAARPILALCDEDGDTAWVLRRSGAVYRIADPSSSEAIRVALMDLVEMVDAGASFARRCRPENTPFTRESLAAELAHVLNEISRRRSE
jgi:glycosyltransferase involved in cell wall biosynthesis